MRILFCHRPQGAFGYITDGMINALRDRSHVVERWDGILSSWQSFAPDLYIACSGHQQPIPDKIGKCKLATHVNPYGPVKVKGIDETLRNIAWVVARQPDVVFGYGQESDRVLWSYWTGQYGIPWVPMPTAGDRTIFNLGDEAYRVNQVVYLGGRWPYKSANIDSYLLPVVSDRRVVSAVYGWGDWPAGVCRGGLDDAVVCHFLGSGRVAPCVSEPHTQQYGFDIPERAFKAALCGTLVVHDPVPGLTGLIPSAVVAKDPADYLDKCVYYSRDENSDERIELAARQRSEVLAGQTYHHRMRDLLAALGLTREAENMVS